VSLLSTTASSLVLSIADRSNVLQLLALDLATGVATTIAQSSQAWASVGDQVFENGALYVLSPMVSLSLVTPTATTVLASAGIETFAVTPSSIYFSDRATVQRMPHGGGPFSLVDAVGGDALFAVSPHFVVWATRSGEVHYCLHHGGPVGVLASNLGYARALAADDTYAYVSTLTSVVRLDLATKAMTVLMAHSVDGLVVDAPFLYWYRTNTGDIGKVAIAGGSPTILTSMAGRPGIGRRRNARVLRRPT
jgi:hypothetical protein